MYQLKNYEYIDNLPSEVSLYSFCNSETARVNSFTFSSDSSDKP